MAKTLVTGATGFIGSHVARLLVERGDDLRLAVQEGSDDELIRDLDVERVTCDVLDRRAVRRALKGVERVFHAAGVTSVRGADRELLFSVNVGGTKTVLGECLRAGVERVVYTSSAATVGPAVPGRTADEEQLYTAGHLGIPYVNSVHEAEVEAMRLAARGLPVVCVNPGVCFGSGDVHLASTRLVRSFLLGRLPLYTDGAICVVDVRDVAEGHLLADQRGKVARALHPGRPQLHVRPALRGPRAHVGGRAPGEAAGPAGALRRQGAGHRARAPDAGRGPGGRPLVDLPLEQGQARTRAGGPVRTKRRSRPRSAGTSTASTTGSPGPGARSSSSSGWPGRRSGRWRAPRAWPVRCYAACRGRGLP